MQSLVNFTYVFLFLAGLVQSSVAQQSIIVVNGGIFGSSSEFANVSIENLATGVFSTMDTIYETSIQDIVIEGQYAYVAAQDSIVKYDWTTQTRVAAAAFDAPSTINMEIHGGNLLVGNWYAPWGWTGPYNKHFLAYNKNTLALVDSVPEVTMPAKDFVVVGDYAYIGQNASSTTYSDTMGYVAVVDLNTFNFVRYDTLSTMGDDVGRLVAEGNMVYSINGTSNTISSYNTVTFAKNTQAAGTDLKPKGNGPTAYTKGAGVWYFPYDSGIGSYNLSTNTIVTPNIVNITGSFAYAMDTVNDRFCVSHIDFTNQLNNKGRVYDMNGDSVGMFQVGYSPEALAIVSSAISGTITIAQADELAYEVYPNPTSTTLNIAMDKAEAVNISIINQVGQTVLYQKGTDLTTTINVESLAVGVYFVAVVNEAGKMRVERFVKK